MCRSLDDDRIIRRFAQCDRQCVCAPTSSSRTRWRPAQSYLPSSWTPHKLDDCPRRARWREIFVYSPQVEGVHLRFGKVARGGMRWSRPARGFPHRGAGPGEGAAGQERGDRAGGRQGRLLSQAMPANATRDAGSWQPASPPTRPSSTRCSTSPTICNPTARWCRRPMCVRHDGDDPYLVVAADKGTATFSDIANGIAEDYGFWLGDAFASGGSHGYDHKKMGITARGAWEAVKRHFREMGRDIQNEPFTVHRRRRHVGRRVRQRHAAVEADPAGGGLRPPPHLPRSRARPGRRAGPSASACSTCRARAGTITTRR